MLETTVIESYRNCCFILRLSDDVLPKTHVNETTSDNGVFHNVSLETSDGSQISEANFVSMDKAKKLYDELKASLIQLSPGT